MKKTVYLIFSIMILFAFNFKLYSEEKVVFLHIPKTGGVTVYSFLQDQYTAQEIANNKGPYSYHVTYPELTKLHQEGSYVTFLRHPVDRVLSEERYCIGKHRGDPTILKAHFLPIQGNPIETASNVACKMLSELDYRNPSIPIEKHLESAKEVLAKKFFFVGITEKMKESIEILCTLLGWSLPEEIPSFNSTEAMKHDYPQDLLEAIAQRNRVDIELYEYALTLFKKQQVSIQAMRAGMKKVDPVFLDNYVYTFEAKLDGYGWCPRESNGATYRWASSTNKAAIHCFLRTDQSYHIQARVLIQPAFVEYFRLVVNETPIPIQTNIPDKELHSLEFKWVYFRGTIPQSCLKTGEKMKISFEMSSPQGKIMKRVFERPHPLTKLDENFSRGKFACSQIAIIPF